MNKTQHKIKEPKMNKKDKAILREGTQVKKWWYCTENRSYGLIFFLNKHNGTVCMVDPFEAEHDGIQVINMEPKQVDSFISKLIEHEGPIEEDFAGVRVLFNNTGSMNNILSTLFNIEDKMYE